MTITISNSLDPAVRNMKEGSRVNRINSAIARCCTSNRIPPAVAACHETYWEFVDSRLNSAQRANLKHCCSRFPTVRIS